MFLYSSSLLSTSPALLTGLIILLCHKYASTVSSSEKKKSQAWITKMEKPQGKEKEKKDGGANEPMQPSRESFFSPQNNSSNCLL